MRAPRAAIGMQSGSRNGTRKFTPMAPGVSRGRRSSSASSDFAGISPPATMATAPAPATAQRSSGVENPGMDATWIGTAAPTSRVNAVSIMCEILSHVAVRAREHHDVAIEIAEPDLALVRVRVRHRPFENLGGDRARACDRRVEVRDLEPQQNPVPVGLLRRIAHVRMLVAGHVPEVELQDHLPRAVDELLVLVAAVPALAAEDALVPETARRDVANRDQGLGLH